MVIMEIRFNSSLKWNFLFRIRFVSTGTGNFKTAFRFRLSRNWNYETAFCFQLYRNRILVPFRYPAGKSISGRTLDRLQYQEQVNKSLHNKVKDLMKDLSDLQGNLRQVDEFPGLSPPRLNHRCSSYLVINLRLGHHLEMEE